MEDWNTRETDTVIYKLKIESGTDKIVLIAREYMYMIHDSQNKPLGTIEIQKSR